MNIYILLDGFDVPIRSKNNYVNHIFGNGIFKNVLMLLFSIGSYTFSTNINFAIRPLWECVQIKKVVPPSDCIHAENSNADQVHNYSRFHLITSEYTDLIGTNWLFLYVIQPYRSFSFEQLQKLRHS